MKINLVRIDDRLIHGQVATVWSKEANAQRIIICSDEVAKDQIRKTLLLQVGPPGVKVSVVDVAKAVRVYNNPKYEKDTVFFLYTCPQDVLRMAEATQEEMENSCRSCEEYIGMDLIKYYKENQERIEKSQMMNQTVGRDSAKKQAFDMAVQQILGKLGK